jgi:hypothetical protein
MKLLCKSYGRPTVYRRRMTFWNKLMIFELVSAVLKHSEADMKVLVCFLYLITILPAVSGCGVLTYAYSFVSLRAFRIGHLLQEFSLAKIVNERKQLRRCMTAHSRPNVALIQGKVNICRPNLRELRNYTLAGYHTSRCCIIVDYIIHLTEARSVSFPFVNVDNIMWSVVNVYRVKCATKF